MDNELNKGTANPPAWVTMQFWAIHQKREMDPRMPLSGDRVLRRKEPEALSQASAALRNPGTDRSREARP